jgi:hypothetical protein
VRSSRARHPLQQPPESSRRRQASFAEEPERLPDFAPGTTEIVVHSFVADAPVGWQPQLDDEHDAFRWCSQAEAVELLFWPEPKELVRSL